MKRSSKKHVRRDWLSTVEKVTMFVCNTIAVIISLAMALVAVYVADSLLSGIFDLNIFVGLFLSLLIMIVVGGTTAITLSYLWYYLDDSLFG